MAKTKSVKTNDQKLAEDLQAFKGVTTSLNKLNENSDDAHVGKTLTRNRSKNSIIFKKFS
jgi:hypothetical protein